MVIDGTPVTLVTGAGRAGNIAASVVPTLRQDGWDVVTSDLVASDYPCDLADAAEASGLIDRVRSDHGTLSGLVLCHALDVPQGSSTPRRRASASTWPSMRVPPCC